MNLIVPTFWTTSRLNRLATSLLFVFLVIISFSFLYPQNASLFWKGDFPGFYSPAWTIAHGESSRLYDLNLQKEIQNRFWPDFQGAFYISVYPPYTAMLLSPFGYLSPGYAKLVATCAALLFLIGTILISIKSLPILYSNIFAYSLLSLFFSPLLVSILSSQNTTLSLLLYTGAFISFSWNTKKGDILAGALLALWLFKPQYGLLAMLMPLIAKRYWVILGYAPVIMIYYFFGYELLGSAWLSEWYHAATQFGDINYTINAQQMVSLVGFGKYLGYQLGHENFFTLLAYAISFLLFVFITYEFYRIRSEKEYFNRVFMRLAPVLILISPQTLFYDLGIIATSLLYCTRFNYDRDITTFLLFLVLALGVEVMRVTSAINLYFPLALLMCVYILNRTRESYKSS